MYDYRRFDGRIEFKLRDEIQCQCQVYLYIIVRKVTLKLHRQVQASFLIWESLHKPFWPWLLFFNSKVIRKSIRQADYKYLLCSVKREILESHLLHILKTKVSNEQMILFNISFINDVSKRNEICNNPGHSLLIIRNNYFVWFS